MDMIINNAKIVKKQIMKIRYIHILLCVLAFIVMSCEEKANDWEFDTSHDRLFRTTLLETSNVNATSVQLHYKGVKNATKYVFEFSEGDSLLFNNIVRTVDIKADTLSPYVSATTDVKTEYHTLFEGLNGTTRYSVRMKAVNEVDGMESGYVNVSFITSAEQIFTDNIPGVASINLSWIPESKVTNLLYGEVVTESDTIWATRYMITGDEKSVGNTVLNGLRPGTNYVIRIYNDKVLRGELRLKTLGSQSGKTLFIQPNDNVTDSLTKYSTIGITDISLVFTGGKQYEIGEIIVPVGINNLYLVGDVASSGLLPELYLYKVTFSAPMKNLYYQYVNIDAKLNSANYLFNISDEKCFENISFEGCTIQNIVRSLLYVNKDNLLIKDININKCIVRNVASGGYGLLNVSKSTVTLDLISITNTTMIDIGDQLMQTKNAVGSIVVDKSIFCNYNIGIPKIFRFDKQPLFVKVTNSIFTGDNKGAKVNSGNGDYSSYLDFSSCYLTSDFVMDSRKFTNAVTLAMPSEDLFVDPRNGDFHIKEGVKFTGAGKVGDPRWW